MTGLMVAAVLFLIVGYVRCVADARRRVKNEQDFLRGLVPHPGVVTGNGKEKISAVGRLADGACVGLELITDTLALRWLPRQLVVVRVPLSLPITRRIAFIQATAESGLTTVGLHDPGDELGPDEQLIVRLPGQEHLLPEAIAVRVRKLFADPRVQQLLLRPDGLRMVYEVGTARADAYRITRKVEIARSTLAGSGVRRAIDEARQVAVVVHTIKTEDRPAMDTQPGLIGHSTVS